MSNPNDGYAKRKEMSVQGLACTFSLSNIDAYFLVEDERVSYKSKVVASGMMYRILGQNTDILVFVDGLYNFINENVPSRHFYGYIQNEKIRDVYFDQDQINHVDELIMAEYSKTEILSKQAFHYSIQHQEINEQLKNADEMESYRIWDDVINKIYDDVDLDCFTKDEEELAEERLADYYYEI